MIHILCHISGALGPVDGVNPELSNLTCSMTYVEPGDIVFLTSDGISDNFDPVVGKFCVPRRTDRPGIYIYFFLKNSLCMLSRCQNPKFES